jgi:hypothetical protein
MLGGVKMSSAIDSSKRLNGRQFEAPSNVEIPAAVGEYL